MTYLPINLPHDFARPQSPAELARREQTYYEDNAGPEWRAPPIIEWAAAQLLRALEDALRLSSHGIHGRRTATKATSP